MSIGEKASQGFFSFLTRNIISRFMGLISLFILARKLSPFDFGLVSFTDILLMFIAVFGSTGLNEFLIAYKKDDYLQILKASFWFNCIITLGVIFLFFTFIPFWASSKNDSRIINLAFISGLIFFITQLQIIPKAILSRNLDFKTTVKIQNPFIIIIPIAKIIAALSGFGVYSLTVPTLIFLPIQTIWYYRAVSWKFEWKLYTDRWKEIYHFTKHLIGNSLLTRLMDDGDKLFLSSFIGLKALGVYNMAYQLSSFVGLNIVSLTGSILVSVLPKYRDNLSQMKSHYLNFTKVLAFFTFPIIAIMACYAEPLIIAINGEKWVDAVIPFQILSLYAMIRAVTSSRGAVLNTLHLNKNVFKLNLIYTPIHIAFSIIFSYYSGLIGLAVSVVILRIVFATIGANDTMKSMNGSLYEFIYSLKTPAKIVFYTSFLCLLTMYLIPSSSFKNFIISFEILFLNKFVSFIYITFLILFSIVYFTLLVRYIFKNEIIDISLFIKNSNKKVGNMFEKVFITN
ncbi:MAG: oligosaccharide flippase family protein [Bacteroidota bacterium]